MLRINISILFFGLIFFHAESQNNISVNENTIDSIYNNLSLDEKLDLILVTDNSNNNKINPDSVSEKLGKIRWLCFDSIYSHNGIQDPMLSDVMVRSSFMGKHNNKDLNLAVKILENNHRDGFYYLLKSPYSFLFQSENSSTADFLLEPFGRISMPYLKDGKLQVFTSNTYKMPGQILAPFNIRSKKIMDLQRLEYVDFTSADWKNLNKFMKEYEHPCLEMILTFGGVIFSNNKQKDFSSLKRAFDNDLLSEQILEKSCKKMIEYHLLLHNSPGYKTYFNNDKLIQQFITNIYAKGNVLLENKGIIPINNFKNRKIASLHIGSENISEFQKNISKYCQCDHFDERKIPDEKELFHLRDKMAQYNTIIVAVNGDWLNDNTKEALYSFLHQISSDAELILVHFGSGNNLENLPKEHPFKAVLLSFELNDLSQSFAAQILFGGISAQGKLAKNINPNYPFGTGLFTQKCRLGYFPVSGIAMQDTLSLIDQVAYKAIRERATPGCQVLVVKDGNVIYDKAFGYHTYNKKRHVETSDLYDIASVTKIVASVPSVMKMVDEGKITIDDSLSQHIPRLLNTNKSGMIIANMLIHQAGLQSWIPFYLETIDKDKLHGENLYSRKYTSVYNIKLDKHLYLNKAVHYRSDIFRHSKSDDFSIQVTDKWYMNKNYVDSMYQKIDASHVSSHPKYLYSDLGYYYLKEIIESKYQQPINKFVETNFYNKLGAYRTLYKPLEKYNKKEIIPTEDDKIWRNELIQGYVHDPGAAMLGGVGGHAGVFSDSEGLAKILQMYLYKGAYGGEHYIDSTTIVKFTSVYKEGNRRGLGFDKPVLEPDIAGPTSKEVSESSFGHSGFTGTLVWADPKYNLIYVFLSNRINPNQYNKKLIKTDVRTKIQSAIYRSLPEYWEGKE